MFEKLKNIFKKSAPVVVSEPKPKKPRAPRKPKSKTPEPQLSEKELATAHGLPYIKILEVDIDPANINSGSMTFDWNDKFILNLVRAGYKQRDDDTDSMLVDRWFQTVCRNIALEVYEQQAADSSTSEYEDLRRIQRKDIGDGRSEIS
jgi:hypothetical protein